MKELRRSYGESQAEFAERFRVAVDTVKGWEQGRWAVSGMATVILDELEARRQLTAKVG